MSVFLSPACSLSPPFSLSPRPWGTFLSALFWSLWFRVGHAFVFTSYLCWNRQLWEAQTDSEDVFVTMVTTHNMISRKIFLTRKVMQEVCDHDRFTHVSQHLICIVLSLHVTYTIWIVLSFHVTYLQSSITRRSKPCFTKQSLWMLCQWSMFQLCYVCRWHFVANSITYSLTNSYWYLFSIVHIS